MTVRFLPGSQDWLTAPLHYRWQRHRAVTRALVDDRHGHDRVYRCSCGAFGPAPWIFLDKPTYKRLWRKP